MKNIFCFTALFLCTTVSFASVYVDPSLKDAFKRAQSSKSNDDRITVIVTFAGDLKVSRAGYRKSTHEEIQRKLMEINSQNVSDLKFFLESQINLDDSQVKATKLWIINGMALRLPTHVLLTLIKSPNIDGIYANHKVKLFRPMDHGIVDRKYLVDGGYTYGLEKIKLPQVNEKAPEVTGKGVRVGILDSGIDAEHPDLKGKVAVWKDIVESSSTPTDGLGHGTHVAGTIAGGDSSGTKIGVAPGATLVIGRIFGSSGSTTWEIVLKGMQWISDPDSNPSTNDFPALVSNSWGGGAANPGKDPNDDPLCKALASWAKLGMLPVFAAGNAGSRPKTVNLPGACPDAVTVGATDSKDQIASFSSRGPAVWKTGSFIKPNVSAPGVEVISSVPGGKYKAYSGTSMATPHTAGVSSLLYQLAPNMSVPTMRDLLQTTSQDLGDPGNDNNFGYGRIDSFEAVKKLVKAMHQ